MDKYDVYNYEVVGDAYSGFEFRKKGKLGTIELSPLPGMNESSSASELEISGKLKKGYFLKPTFELADLEFTYCDNNTILVDQAATGIPMFELVLVENK